MRDYSLCHVSDAVLMRDLATLVAQDRETTATLLAHIAEVDARRLYVPAGYSSMHGYCVDELRLSEDAAYKRIQAGRAARQFPGLFGALADGRLHLTGVCLLAPHLTPENANELIEAAADMRRSEIEELLARRYPPQEIPMSVRAFTPLPTEPAPLLASATSMPDESSDSPGTSTDQLAPEQVQNARSDRPACPDRFLLQVTIESGTHEKIRYAQNLLSHALPSGDLAQVIDRALDALIVQLEKSKLGRTTRRRRVVSTSTGRRHIPAEVRRGVWERDQGRCTFVSPTGHRCDSRRFLEYDHVEPVARGGIATVDGVRLRCRTHNQHEAERVFGAEFMRRRRQAARLASAEARQRAAEARARAEANEQYEDLLAGLRSLGCRGELARRAADFAQTVGVATLEDQLRAALQFIGKRAIQAGTARMLPAPADGLPSQSDPRTSSMALSPKRSCSSVIVRGG